MRLPFQDNIFRSNGKMTEQGDDDRAGVGVMTQHEEDDREWVGGDDRAGGR